MYDQKEFIKDCLALFDRVDGNIANIPDRGEIKMYDTPLIGFAYAADELFETYRQPEVIGSNFFGPLEWLPTAKTVVSLFLPLSDAVRISNRADRTKPSAEWLYARIEGQEFISRYTAELKRMLERKSIDVCAPGLDERFNIKFEPTSAGEGENFHVDSRWSERHAAYACGLGTFGLSRSLISEKGMAGRYTSLIVSEEWEQTGRNYTGINDYCTMCGACVRKCPVHAISLEHGKNNVLCKAYLDKTKEEYSPRYGCGKCQVGVPCEFRAPGMKGKA